VASKIVAAIEKKHPRQQRTEAYNTLFPVERMERAPDTLCHQPMLLRAVRRHHQTPDRKEVRMFMAISIGKILGPIGFALSYQAAADAGSNWGITCLSVRSTPQHLHHEIDQ
jgi:hypothetical protein